MTTSKSSTKNKSEYFDFKKLSRSIENIIAYEYIGWNGLNVTKFYLPAKTNISNSLIDQHYPDLIKKEKIFVTTQGNLKLKSDEFNALFKEFDAVDFASARQNYTFNSLEDTTIFMIGAKDSKFNDSKNHFFNFKKDIKAKDLWGGQIISRPYEGMDLTLVLFDLKPGFKFEDKGHSNEQITWLTKGLMEFYANGEKKTITPDIGVDIGPNHVHGGVSSGAIGFDAFFPKRQETKYKKN
jgi:quercetin dioxygenase-like cupin family protein